jgi:hypothetical protein
VSTDSFPLPPSTSDFVQMMDVKVKDLITLGVWDVDPARYRGWLNQFTSDEEQFFAACVLDNLIYRPKAQFTASLRALILGPLRWELESIIPGHSDLDLQVALAQGSINGLVVIPAIDETEPPTKSGPFIVRRLKKALGLHDRSMDWPWTTAKRVQAGKVSTVIVLDDFIGTGHQVVNYLEGTFVKLDPNVKWIYAAVAAHRSGIEFINQRLPNLKVFSAEIFDEEHGLFYDRYWKTVSNQAIGADAAKEFYLKFLLEKGLATPNSPFKEMPLGYGGKALCLGFEHGTPDNSLPILWAPHNGWQPLLER